MWSDFRIFTRVPFFFNLIGSHWIGFFFNTCPFSPPVWCDKLIANADWMMNARLIGLHLQRVRWFRVFTTFTVMQKQIAAVQLSDPSRSAGIQQIAKQEPASELPGTFRRSPACFEHVREEQLREIAGLQKRMRVEFEFRTHLNCRTYTIPWTFELTT